MTKKQILESLIRNGNIIREPAIGWDQVEIYLKRSKKDIQTARKVIVIDEASAMDLVYKSMFHASNALIRAYGYRPGKIRQHTGVIEATSALLGKDVEMLMEWFNRLRIKRNEFEYAAVFKSSETEIRDGFLLAESLLEKIEIHLTRKNPQKKLSFRRTIRQPAAHTSRSVVRKDS